MDLLSMFPQSTCCSGFRKATKESLVQTSSDITESLMSISRMMSQQVKQSEETIGTLGKKRKNPITIMISKCPSIKGIVHAQMSRNLVNCHM